MSRREAEALHAQMVKLFAGQFGELFDSHTLEGKKGSELSNLTHYLAVTAKRGQLTPHYITLAPALPRAKAVADRVQKYRLKPGEANGIFAGVLYAKNKEAISKDLREAAVASAETAVSKHGLPIVFISFLRNLYGVEKVVLWYPKTAPAEQLLETLKTEVKKAF